MMLIMLGFGVASLRWAEKLPVGDGFGWDGVNYGTWAKDFHKAVFVDRVEDYYVQRVVPSGFVHYGARAVLRPFYSHDETSRILSQNTNILLAFGIYNLILILLSVYLWGLIATNLQLSERGRWFGFCFLFINYAILKGNFYTPVSTDISGFVLGMLMFYCFLTRKSWGLLAIMIIGGFTWPTIPILAALFLVLPRPKDPEPVVPLSTASRRLVICLSGLAVILLFAYLLRNDVFRGWHQAGMVRINFALLYSSMFAATIYLLFGFRAALDDRRLFDFRYIFRAIQWKWLAVSVLALLFLRWSVHRLAGPIPSPWTFKDFFLSIFVASATDPFIFVVAHAVYYGPAILLLLIFWRRFCDEAGTYGIGFRLFVMINLLLSIGPQSRYQIPALGAFVLILIRVLDKSKLPRWSFAIWLLLCLFYSKVWYTFNTSPMNPDGTMAVFNTFPLQNLFMNSGPWMSHAMYLVQGTIVLATGIVLAVLVVRRRLPGAVSVHSAIE